ncbi:MAG: preprotein translocase subunit SecA, partial [Patescibacteria group bacterium]
MAGLLGRIFARNESAAFVKAAEPVLTYARGVEEVIKALSRDELVARLGEVRERTGGMPESDQDVAEVFALVREAADRTLHERHYDVQLIGGLALAKGNIAEMRTGEGKTLVATLATTLRALAGKGVHVVTVNDYLARRDGAWMGQIYAYLGLSVGVVTAGGSYIYDAAHTNKEEDAERDEEGSFRVFYDYLRPASKKEAYAADITYATNNEL